MSDKDGKKWVMITGASRGIGRQTAIEMARRGWEVAATMRSPGECSPFPDEVKESIHLFRLDVTDSESIVNVVSELEQIDVVINNAGYALFAPAELCSEEEVHAQFDVNLFGALRVTQAVVPKMRAQKRGHIINISSTAGVVSNPMVGLYSASKHALEALSASLASTLFLFGIHVSVVEPGAVNTEFPEDMHLGDRFKESSPYGDIPKKYLEQITARIHEGQDPKEVARVIADVAENPHPNFRTQTSAKVTQTVSRFIKDPTGNEWLEQQKKIIADLL